MRGPWELVRGNRNLEGEGYKMSCLVGRHGKGGMGIGSLMVQLNSHHFKSRVAV